MYSVKKLNTWVFNFRLIKFVHIYLHGTYDVLVRYSEEGKNNDVICIPMILIRS